MGEETNVLELENDSSEYSMTIVDSIESGFEAKEQERTRFFELAERLARSRNPEEQDRIKEDLARLTLDRDAQDPMDRPTCRA